MERKNEKIKTNHILYKDLYKPCPWKWPKPLPIPEWPDPREVLYEDMEKKFEKLLNIYSELLVSYNRILENLEEIKKLLKNYVEKE